MKLTIKTKNLKLTKELEDHINDKIGGLEKFINLAEVVVEVQRETEHHRKGNIFKAEVIIFLPGKKIIAVAQGDDLLLAIVEVKDKLQQELKKYKLKNTESRRRLQKKSKNELTI